jgi:hypothetical protein
MLDATDHGMTNRSLALIVAFALVACRGQNQAKRSTPNYDVVAEGSASGVTSTINGPGEKPAAVTDTNVDTTTNFTLPNNPNPLGNETAGASVAGTLPSTPTYPGAANTPLRRTVPPGKDTHGMASSSAPIVTDTIGSTTPPMPKETRTKPRSDSDADTTTASADTTPADTATTPSPEPETTSTAPRKKIDRSKKPDDQQPPPPPPPTDTTGTQG